MIGESHRLFDIVKIYKEKAGRGLAKKSPLPVRERGDSGDLQWIGQLVAVAFFAETAAVLSDADLAAIILPALRISRAAAT